MEPEPTYEPEPVEKILARRTELFDASFRRSKQLIERVRERNRKLRDELSYATGDWIG